MTNHTVTYRPSAPSLPTTVKDLSEQRRSLRVRSVNDDVEDAHLKLWEIPEYQRYFQPIWDSESVEGKIEIDYIQAAARIREFASRNALPIAASAKLDAIVKSIRVVCRRYNIDLKTRREMVGGVSVRRPMEDDQQNNAEYAA